LRGALAAKGRQRAGFFSWHKAAEQTLGVYLELLGRSADVRQELAATMSEQSR
jgi:hypothetical protein